MTLLINVLAEKDTNFDKKTSKPLKCIVAYIKLGALVSATNVTQCLSKHRLLYLDTVALLHFYFFRETFSPFGQGTL